MRTKNNISFRSRPPGRILVVVQRSNGDVLLSAPLIEGLFRAYGEPEIDLLVNSDTVAVARMLPHIVQIHQFSYGRGGKLRETTELVRKITGRYDLCINLTSSDRSVLFALLASSRTISAVEQVKKKSWWKRLLLDGCYDFDPNRHIIENNTSAFGLLGIGAAIPSVAVRTSGAASESVERLLAERGIREFVIFHPGAQYRYKVYPEESRRVLLERLDTLGIPIVVTGSKSEVDLEIKRSLPGLSHLHDFIGLTSIDELVALSDRSLAYIGADTLNMHIAASQGKEIFAIFGPTILSMWSPWSNELGRGTRTNMPVQRYGNVTVFQADMACVACGRSGCDDHHGRSDCLYRIEPETIFKEVAQWRTTSR